MTVWKNRKLKGRENLESNNAYDEDNKLQQDGNDKDKTTVISINDNVLGLRFLDLALLYLNDVKVIIKSHREEERDDMKRAIKMARILINNLTLEASPENFEKISVKGSLTSKNIDAVISDFEYVQFFLKLPEKACSKEAIQRYNHGKAMLEAFD